MAGNQVTVLHGTIDDVSAEVRWCDDVGIVNANVSLSGTGWSLEFPLSEVEGLAIPASVAVAVEQGYDAIWMFGRIRSLFGSWIDLDEEGEKSILSVGFGAYFRSRDCWIPFVLIDRYLRGALLFGETLTDDSTKRAIAIAFYRLLLAEHDVVCDFEFRKDHIGAGFTMVGGIVHGEIQYDEVP